MNNKPPISKLNLQLEEKDYIIPLSYIFGPGVTHLTIDEKWAKIAQPGHPTTGGHPYWAPDPQYMMETVRGIVEEYKLYHPMHDRWFVLQVIFRDPETWGLFSEVPSILPDLEDKGFRLRIDHFISHNLGREDLAWGMILEELKTHHPWQGVIHEDQLPRIVDQVKKHFEANNLIKTLQSNKIAFLGIKDTPHRQMIRKPHHHDEVAVYVPESFWQIEFVDSDLIRENPLKDFYKE